MGGIAYSQRDNIGSLFSSSTSNSQDSGSNNGSNKNDDGSDNTDDSTPDDDTDNGSGSSNGSGSPASLNSVNVIINDASQYDSVVEVRSYVEGIIETDGTCTLTFTKDGTSFTKTTSPLTNPSYTTCKTIDIPVSEFSSKGTWQLTVSYLSSTSKGSATKTLEVK